MLSGVRSSSASSMIFDVAPTTTRGIHPTTNGDGLPSWRFWELQSLAVVLLTASRPRASGSWRFGRRLPLVPRKTGMRSPEPELGLVREMHATSWRSQRRVCFRSPDARSHRSLVVLRALVILAHDDTKEALKRRPE